MAEITHIKTGNKFGEVVQLDEYKGQISIISAREGNDGKMYAQWVFPQDKDRQPRDKAIPLKVTLGDPETAVRYLRYLADILEDFIPQPDHSQFEGGVDDDSEIPF